MANIFSVNPETQDRGAFLTPEEQAQLENRNQGGFLQSAADTAQMFNTGVVDLLSAPISVPVDMLNSVLPERFQQRGGSEDFRALGNSLGITAKPGERPETFGQRVAYEVGASAVPTAAILRLGKPALSGGEQVLRSAQEIANKPGLLTQYARTASSRPGAMVAGEGAAAVGAASGASLANLFFPDSESAEVVGHLTGGLAPSAILSFSPVAQLVRRGAEMIPEQFTLPGSEMRRRSASRAQRRAAARLQSEVADPQAAVSQLDALSDTPLTPARAIGDPNLIALESAVSRKFPAVREQVSEDLRNAVEDLRNQAREIGNISGQERVREILTNRRNYLLGNLEVQSAQAGEEYASALARLGSDADSRQIQAAFNNTVETSYNVARAQERQNWSAIDRDAAATLNNSRNFISSERATRTEAADPADIPNYVVRLTAASRPEDPTSVIELTPRQKQQIERLERDQPVSVQYIQDLRSRVLQDIRSEKAKDAPNRNKIRILSNLQENLLEDMQTASGQSEMIDTALAYSRDLNQRYMQGRVGKMLGFERTGGSSVDPADSIQFILGGGTPATNVRKALEAVPESADDLSNFLKNQYAISSVKPDGSINQTRSRAFFNKYSQLIDQLPGVRQDLEGASQRGVRQQDLLKRKNTLEGILGNKNKSVASLYLNEPMEDAMAAMFKSKQPTVLAANLRRRMQGDKQAIEGLKYSYGEHLFNVGKSARLDEETGEAILDGPKMLNEISSTRSAAKTLGLSESDLDRLETIARSISRANRYGGPTTSDGAQVGKIIGDTENYILNSFAAVLGARAGAATGGRTMAGRLQASTRGSTLFQKVANYLTRDNAEEILAAATVDKSLYRKLLLTPSASVEQKNELARTLKAYIPSAAQAEIDREMQRQEEEGQIRGRLMSVPRDSSNFMAPQTPAQ